MAFLRSLFTSSAKKAKKEEAALAASTTAALLAQKREETARLEALLTTQAATREVEIWASEQREERLQAQIDHLLLVADKRAERARYFLGRAQQYRRTAAYGEEDERMMEEVERQEAIGLESELGSVERKSFLSPYYLIHHPLPSYHPIASSFETVDDIWSTRYSLSHQTHHQPPIPIVNEEQ